METITINFRMKEKEAEWSESRRQVRNDLEYEKNQAQRKCAAEIERAQRKAYERLKAISIEEDAYKAKATEAKNARRAQELAELERIDELAAKHNRNREEIPMQEGGQR